MINNIVDIIGLNGIRKLMIAVKHKKAYAVRRVNFFAGMNLFFQQILLRF